MQANETDQVTIFVNEIVSLLSTIIENPTQEQKDSVYKKLLDLRKQTTL